MTPKTVSREEQRQDRRTIAAMGRFSALLRSLPERESFAALQWVIRRYAADMRAHREAQLFVTEEANS